MSEQQPKRSRAPRIIAGIAAVIALLAIALVLFGKYLRQTDPMVKEAEEIQQANNREHDKTVDGKADATPSTPVATREDPLSGIWQGRWASQKHGMDGRLTAKIQPLGDGRYRATYVSEGVPVVGSLRTVVDLDVEQTEEGWALTGRVDAGWYRGGIYNYTGLVTGEDLQCNYTTNYDDKGSYELKWIGELQGPDAELPETADPPTDSAPEKQE